ncbi:MAG: hypothetical protein RRZ84_06560 [Romboutsia sp.]
MKQVGLLLSSICIFLVILVNFYYNSVTLDVQKMKYYVIEANMILEDIVKKEDYVEEKKDEYISRLLTLKKGIENSKTTFIVSEYKNYKLKSIESLIYSVSQKSSRSTHLENVIKYNTLGEKELDKLVNKNFMKVTYLSNNTYI